MGIWKEKRMSGQFVREMPDTTDKVKEIRPEGRNGRLDMCSQGAGA